MKTIKYFFYILGIFIFFIAARPARAFGVSPAKILLTVDPGSSQTVAVKIKNDENTSLNFKLGVLGVKQNEQGGPVFTRGEDASENWVYPESNPVNIKPDSVKDVNFIIKIPADALPGSYYLGLFAEPVWPKGAQANVNTRLVSLLTLQVSGLVSESLAIEKWAPLAGVSGEKKWKFDLLLKNVGAIEMDMRGSIALRNWKGEEIFSQSLVLGNKLLAGAKRALQPEIVLRDDIKLPGLYQVQVKINYGKTNLSASSLAYVWYFPVWSKVVLVLAVLLIVVLIFWRIKRVKR